MLAFAMAASVEAVALPPIDQCAANSSFRRFRGELIRALDRKDVRYVTGQLGLNVTNDFGGSHGRDEFIRIWKLDQPHKSKLWRELRLVLSLGCTLDGKVASSPSLLDQLPPDRDAFMTLLAIRPNAAVRARPSDASPVVATLNWELLTIAEKGAEEGWFPVVLRDGAAGYIRQDDVRSPLDYRVVFQKRGDRWEITALVAGD